MRDLCADSQQGPNDAGLDTPVARAPCMPARHAGEQMNTMGVDALFCGISPRLSTVTRRRPTQRRGRTLPKMSSEDAQLAWETVRARQLTLEPEELDGETADHDLGGASPKDRAGDPVAEPAGAEDPRGRDGRSLPGRHLKRRAR